jgi:hypothetical protein
MHVSCTLELLKKIKALPFIEESPIKLNAWYAKIFRHQRKQYIAALESSTLVTVLFRAIEINSIQDFEQALRQSIMDLFTRRNWKQLLGRQVHYDSNGIHIGKIADRRLMGSLNEMTRLAHWEIDHSENIDIATDRINEAPMSLISSAPEWLLDKMIKGMGPHNLYERQE